MSRALCVVVTWDWKAQPDIADLDAAMSKVYNGSNRPKIQEVPNTGGDEYAVIVSSGPTDPQAAWDRRCDDPDDDWDDAEPFWMPGREGLSE